MVLVSYPDSDSDPEPTTEISKSTHTSNTTSCSRKRKADDSHKSMTDTKPGSATARHLTKPPPPLPPTFHTLYATNVRTGTSDDPTLHGGRKRQITHVQGNWPSHISLEWLPTKTQLQKLDELISQVQDIITIGASDYADKPSQDTKVNSFLRSSLGAQQPLHISLSAPLVLSTATKHLFRDRIDEATRNAKVGAVVVRPASLDLVPNFEKSRWFLVVRLDEEEEKKMKRLLDVCNRVCEEFELPLLYQRGGDVGVDVVEDSLEASIVDEHVERPRDNEDGHDPSGAFHISIAWTLTGVSDAAREAIQRIELGHLGGDEIVFDRMKIKIGNVVEDVVL